MSDTERLQAELEIAELVEQFSALRPVVENPDTKTDEAMAEYRRLNDAIAAKRTEFKQKYSPPPAEPGDASPTPAPVTGGVGSVGPEGSDTE